MDGLEALPIKAENLDSIPEDLRSLYAESEGGGFQFQRPDSLLNVGKHEKAKRQEVQAKLDEQAKQNAELASKLEAIQQERQKKEAEETGNYDSIKKSFDEKAGKIEETYKGQLSEKDQLIKDLTVGQKATELAASLFGEDADLHKHIVKDRLSVEQSNGKATVIVLDADGQPSAASVDELRDEIFNNPKYARIVVGSNASGGGANGSSAKGGGANQKTIKSADFYALPEPERKALMKEGAKLV
jgi:hypothetical protein